VEAEGEVEVGRGRRRRGGGCEAKAGMGLLARYILKKKLDLEKMKAETAEAKKNPPGKVDAGHSAWRDQKVEQCSRFSRSCQNIWVDIARSPDVALCRVAC